MQNLDLNVHTPALGADSQGGVRRRHFLQTIGVASLALALSRKTLFAQAPSEAKEWRDLVNRFVYVIADPAQAQTMTAQLNRTPVYYQSRESAPLHTAYSSPHIFVGSTIDPRRVICENGFQVAQLPYYDKDCPCRGVNDINASEIYRVTDPDEMKRFGCVLVPDGPRTEINYSDHAKFGRAASEYSLNVNDWYVPYKRRMTGPRRAHTGYHFVHRTKRTVHGKPVTDFIVASDI
jgi:hypothetical protein